MTSCCKPKDEKRVAKTSCCGSSASPVLNQDNTRATKSSVVSSDRHSQNSSCCPSDKKASIDWLLYGSLVFIVLTYGAYLFNQAFEFYTTPIWLTSLAETSREMFNAMWWGLLLGVVLVGWLNRIPREMIISVLGRGHTKQGIVRATLAGVMLDLCNHGILMVAMKLYERGASLGQVMAFLIASPWNSFTLTLILIGLVGLKLTLLFIVFSMLIAWLTGLLFDQFEMRGIVPTNPNKSDLPDDYRFKSEVKALYKQADWSIKANIRMLNDGFKGSKMVLRWVLFGIVMVALIRAFVPMEYFNTWFGATTSGLFLTLVAATIIEVCSEGSAPIAADLVTRASAPGNAFTFLMAGASTDYTEIMALKDTTLSWKIALFLPLLTVPQILLIGWLLNVYSG